MYLKGIESISRCSKDSNSTACTRNEKLAFITYEFYQIKPLIWTRYSKSEIVSHYGNEFYCPNSLVRVHGKTMMEEFKDADNGASVTMKEIINPPSDLNTSLEKFKLVTPYLALKEFFGDLNPSSNTTATCLCW
ncbi:hypothetical protein HF325_004573 [Metschnikowia pulcherrima]|uniref:SUN domain-containing protein n=1 Tax=Metschnikowia pulcherrima TaxID=27326 RepID=A0A8H7GQR8_9ASCO|nr:hypothetical protein HF325_004573 [Metschnikowia pulcherrima]